MLQGEPPPAGDTTFAALLDPASQSKGEQFLAALRTHGAAAGWELLVRDVQGTGSPRLLRFSGVAAADGFYLTGEDAPGDLDEVARLNNELVNAQRELAREKAALARANQDLADFAAIVSHDLRGPLRNIRQLIELWQQQAAPEPGHRSTQWLEHIAMNAARLHKLIEETLASARGRGHEPPPAGVPLNELVDRLRGDRAFVSRGDLPIVRGVPSQLEILFQNLFENAERHQRPGHPLSVHVSATAAGPAWWRIVLRDNGQGIPAALQNRIFERYYASGNGGTGIGLATCRQVVRRMGGEISAESEAGHGATFSFTLPAADVLPASAPQRAGSAA